MAGSPGIRLTSAGSCPSRANAELSLTSASLWRLDYGLFKPIKPWARLVSNQRPLACVA
jgi:hypothetical protein